MRSRELIAELVIRFLVGGLVVSAFAALGDILQPKSFAGIFAAAPSVALASLILTFEKRGAGYSALLGRSMIVGAASLVLYSLTVAWLLRKYRLNSSLAATTCLTIWLAAALGLWLGLLA